MATPVDMGPNARQRHEAELRRGTGRLICSVCRKLPEDCVCKPDQWFWQQPPLTREEEPTK